MKSVAMEQFIMDLGSIQSNSDSIPTENVIVIIIRSNYMCVNMMENQI